MEKDLIDIASRITVLQADITSLNVDAVVNAANSSLMGGGGVDGAIHKSGGSAILKACKAIVAKQGSCPTGQSVITTAGMMPSKKVIHTVGPVWRGGDNNEDQLLASCYTNSLSLAVQHCCNSIAFPNISTGIYGFPKKRAAQIAVKTVSQFIQNSPAPEKVVFCCFDAENFDLISDELKNI